MKKKKYTKDEVVDGAIMVLLIVISVFGFLTLMSPVGVLITRGIGAFTSMVFLLSSSAIMGLTHISAAMIMYHVLIECMGPYKASMLALPGVSFSMFHMWYSYDMLYNSYSVLTRASVFMVTLNISINAVIFLLLLMCGTVICKKAIMHLKKKR